MTHENLRRKMHNRESRGHDGKRLDGHYLIKRFTRYGFGWTYEGDSPRQPGRLRFYSITSATRIVRYGCRSRS